MRLPHAPCLSAVLALSVLVACSDSEAPEPSGDEETTNQEETTDQGETTDSETTDSETGGMACTDMTSEAACLEFDVPAGACGWASGAVYAADDLGCLRGIPSGSCWMSDVDDGCGESGQGVAWREVDGGIEVVSAMWGCGGWPPPGFTSCEDEAAPDQCACG